MNTAIAKFFSAVIVLSAAGFLHASPAPNQKAGTAESATPADVLMTVELIRANLELIRRELNAEQAGSPVLRVKNAQPAEV